MEGPNTFFPLAWLAKKQGSTARSTTEAEVVSLAQGLFQEALPMLSLWEKLLGRKPELVVMEDNQATIKVVLKGYSPKLRSLVRTQRVDLSSIKEVFDCDDAKIEYVKTDKQAADMFTKALEPAKWQNAMDLLSIVSPSGPSAKASDGEVA